MAREKIEGVVSRFEAPRAPWARTAQINVVGRFQRFRFPEFTELAVKFEGGQISRQMDTKWLQTMQNIVEIQQHDVFLKLKGLSFPNFFLKSKDQRKQASRWKM